MRALVAIAVLVLAGLPTFAVAAPRDRDKDRLPDRWERRHGLSTKSKSGGRDPDRDRLTNRREFRLRTHPRRRDTDRDGLRDGAEVRRHKTKPRRRDTDRDGLRDGAEVRRHKTDPRRRDTDRDGYPDGVEIRAGSDPRDRRSTPGARRSPPPPVGAPGPSRPGPGAPSPARCDVTVDPLTLAVNLRAAVPGAVLCLASGDYGTFRGAALPGLVTLRAAPGARPSMRFDLSGAQNLAIDGMASSGGRISGTTRNVVIRNTTFSGSLTISGLVNANVVLDHNAHVNIDAGSSPARIHLSYRSDAHSGVTVSNSVLAGGDSDGVQTGVGLNIVGNEFRDILQDGPNHTDAIQMLGARGAIVRGNLIHRSTTGIVAYDGLAGGLIEHNVVALDGQPWAIELYSDDGSIVRHNTLVHGSCWYDLPCGMIDLNRKSADDAGRGTVIVDNVTSEVSTQNGSTAATRHHNLVRRQAAPGDLIGAPRYVGGSGYGAFRLAPGSPGWRAASDGTDIGIR